MYGDNLAEKLRNFNIYGPTYKISELSEAIKAHSEVTEMQLIKVAFELIDKMQRELDTMGSDLTTAKSEILDLQAKVAEYMDRPMAEVLYPTNLRKALGGQPLGTKP